MSALVEPWGAVTLQCALADLAAGVVEERYNDGPRIRVYLKRFGLTPPQNWCASAVAQWLWEAAGQLDREAPIAGSPGARATMGQFMRAGLWVPWHELDDSVLVAGNVPVWWRVSPTDWRGHIGIIETMSSAGKMVTIEGNSGLRGDRVARMIRDPADERLLGIGILTGEPVEPSEGRLEEAARLMKLGAEVMLGEPDDPLADFQDRIGEEDDG